MMFEKIWRKLIISPSPIGEKKERKKCNQHESTGVPTSFLCRLGNVFIELSNQMCVRLVTVVFNRQQPNAFAHRQKKRLGVQALSPIVFSMTGTLFCFCFYTDTRTHSYEHSIIL